MAAVLLVTTILMTALIFAVFIYCFVSQRSRRLPLIVLTQTNKPPELPPLPDKHFHLFISHLWSTSQDAAAVIKRQLQLLMPQIRIFLDVDDLEAIDQIERHVQETAVILLFMSRGYFKSSNCLREVTETLRSSKPYILVRETDASKGGAGCQELQMELKQAYREQLFDGHRIVPWHRILHFQLVSLTQIAEDMVSAFTATGQMSSLRIPGSLASERLQFPKPIVLYISDLNPGAEEVGKEMSSRFRDIQVTSTFIISGVGTAHHVQCGPPSEKNEGVQHSMPTRPVLQVPAYFDLEPTHFLLYLNQLSFSGDKGNALADELRSALTAGLTITLVHETDTDRGGCEFQVFFESTPRDLIDRGLFNDLTVPFVAGDAHRPISHLLLAKALGGARVRNRRASHLSISRRRQRSDREPRATLDIALS
mmetsp:Transcript_12306/g.29315  ORF Transcript_12306/g.29315 Transcript_12306/m.29315 type:complete len:424 (+) Transcript_12306:2809-4080(+)